MASQSEIIKSLWNGFNNNPNNTETFNTLANMLYPLAFYRGAKGLSQLPDKLQEAYDGPTESLAGKSLDIGNTTLANLLDVAPAVVAAPKVGKYAAKALGPTADDMLSNYIDDIGGAAYAVSRDRKLRNVSKSKIDEGKISGAPLGVNSPQAEAARRASYKAQMELGAAGRNWYKDSGTTIYNMTGKDADLANKVGETFGVTSANTGVPANTAFAIKGHNQAMAGDPIDTGRFPGSMGKSIYDIYFNEGAASGLKRTPFSDQLAIGGGYYNKLKGTKNRSVHDIWDGEAFGYINPDGTPLRRGFSPAEHNWMDSQMERILKEANDAKLAGFDDWDNGTGQAATWTGAKIRAGDIAPHEAAYSYKDAIQQNLAQGSRESVTGRTVHGHNDGILYAPDDVKQAYDRSVDQLVYTDDGRDKISLGYGMLTDPSFKGPGVFEGRINPGTQTQVAVGRQTGSHKIDPSSEALLNAVESQYGLIGAQDAAAWNTFAPNKLPLKQADRANINMGGTIGNSDMLKLNNLNQALKSKYGLKNDPFALVPTRDGVRIISVDDMGNPDFLDEARGIASQLGLGKGDIQFGSGSNNYIMRPNFMGHINKIEDARTAAGLPSGFDATAPKMAAMWNELDKQFGFNQSDIIVTMRKAIADEGIAGLRKLIAKGVVPAAMVAVIAPYLTEGLAGAKEFD